VFPELRDAQETRQNKHAHEFVFEEAVNNIAAVDAEARKQFVS
jgi:hypothetical protein